MMFYFTLQYVEVQPVWYGVVVHVTAVRCSIISHYSMWKFSQFGMELLSMLLRYDVLLFHITVCGSSVSLVWSCCPCYCGMMFYYFTLQYVEVQSVWYGAVVHVTAVRCSIISHYSMWKFSQFGMELLSMLLLPLCSIISYYSMWKFSQFGMELLSMLLRYYVLLFHITVCGSSVSLVWSCCPCYCGTMFYYFTLQYVEVQSVWYGVVVHVTAVLCSIISYYSMWKFSQFGMELLSMLLLPLCSIISYYSMWKFSQFGMELLSMLLLPLCSIISYYSMWKFSQFGMELLSMLLQYDVLLFHITVCGSSVSLVWSCCPCYCGTMFYYFILQYVEVQSVWYGVVVHVTAVRCSISHYSMWKFSQFGMELLSMLLQYDVLLFHITVCGSSVSLVWSSCPCYCGTMFYYFILQYVEVQSVWYRVVVHVTVVRCSIISYYSMWKFSQFGMELLSMLLLYDVLLFHITVCGSSVSLVWSCCLCYCCMMFYFTLQHVEVQSVWYGVVVHVTAVRCSIISYYSMWKFSQFGMELLSMLLRYNVLLFHITVCGSSVSLVWSCCPCYCGTMFYYFILQYVEVQSVWYGAVVHVTAVRCSIISYYSMWKFSQFGMELLSMLLRYDVLLFHITVCGSSVSLVWSCCPCYCCTIFYYFILQYVEVQSVWYGAVVHVTAVQCSIISYYSMWKFSQFGMELLSMLLQYYVLLFHITVCGSSASLVWSCCPCYCSTMNK